VDVRPTGFEVNEGHGFKVGVVFSRLPPKDGQGFSDAGLGQVQLKLQGGDGVAFAIGKMLVQLVGFPPSYSLAVNVAVAAGTAAPPLLVGAKEPGSVPLRAVAASALVLARDVSR
jgi:hypothetical protein